MASRRRRSWPVPSPSAQHPPSMSNSDLKNRVIASINKLSDRDTRALAIGELEAMAKSLNQDNLSTFVSCLNQTDSSSKPTVRRQVVVLLSTIASSHGVLLVPYLPKLVSTLTRRLGDSDSAVRAACVSAASSLSSCTATDSSSSSLLFGSLLHVLSAEQDFNSQIGAAMCLESMVQASVDISTELLRSALPKLRKLVSSEGFKPKGAVLGVIGSVVGAGGASMKPVLDWIVPCLIGFLSSEDWVSRKAAAEALGKVALKERELAKEYKDGCLWSLENRRFDKVKVVRETMNQTLVLWKQVPEETPDVSEGSSSLTDSTVGSYDCSSFGSSSVASSSFNEPRIKTPIKKNGPSNGSSPSSGASCVTTETRESSIKCLDQKQKHINGKTECVSSVGGTEQAEDFIAHRRDLNSEPEVCKTETKGVLVSTIRSSKSKRYDGLRTVAKVVPFLDDETLHHKDKDCSYPTLESYADTKEIEDLSLIHRQLNQIENQQSNLMHFLQSSIGESQSGINSLEIRLNGLEIALDEISNDIALSNRKFQLPDSAVNFYSNLPSTDISTSKLRKRPLKRSSINRNLIPLEADFSYVQRINNRTSCGPFTRPLTGLTHGRQRDSLSPPLLLNSIHDDVHNPTPKEFWKPHFQHV